MSKKDKIKALNAAVESFSAVFGKAFCDVSEVLKRFEDVQDDLQEHSADNYIKPIDEYIDRLLVNTNPEYLNKFFRGREHKFKPLFTGKQWDEIRGVNDIKGIKADGRGGIRRVSLRDDRKNAQLINCNKRIKNQRKELARLNELNDRARGEIINLRDKNKQLNKLRVELLSEVDDLKNKLEMSESCDFTESDRIKQLEDEREQLINAAESAIDYAGQVSELFKLGGGVMK